MVSMDIATTTSTLQALAIEMPAVVNTTANVTAPAHSIVEMAAVSAWMIVHGIGFVIGIIGLCALIWGMTFVMVETVVTKGCLQRRPMGGEGVPVTVVLLWAFILAIDITVSCFIGNEFGPQEATLWSMLQAFAAGTTGVIATQVAFVLKYQALSTDDDGNVQQGGETEMGDLMLDLVGDEQKEKTDSAHLWDVADNPQMRTASSGLCSGE
ncbi:hypothetical protein LTR49_012831 [Elasticomyces elasticus]|nr:hypothetical protein LTR49_012831 [Elasticomyces elasticus]KAK5763151.1 hypothetical protein LTS12_006740 [Elasticomyces elasticus]